MAAIICNPPRALIHTVNCSCRTTKGRSKDRFAREVLNPIALGHQAGFTPSGSMRGVPDVALQASATTGTLVYDTAPGDAQGGLNCPSGNPCSAGWYVVGGTSCSAPEFDGMVAIADQIACDGLVSVVKWFGPTDRREFRPRRVAGG